MSMNVNIDPTRMNQARLVNKPAMEGDESARGVKLAGMTKSSCRFSKALKVGLALLVAGVAIAVLAAIPPLSAAVATAFVVTGAVLAMTGAGITSYDLITQKLAADRLHRIVRA